MSELRLSYPACTLAEKSTLTPEDVRLIETRIFPCGLDSGNAVATLLALEHCPAGKCAEWDDFFVRILSDHVVNHLHPTGGLTEAKANWVRRALSRGGLVASRNEFEALIRIIEMAGSQGRELAPFALDQIWRAVVEGEGPLASRRRGLWAAVGMDQLNAINRILAATGTAAPLSVAEAEALFDPVNNLMPGEPRSAWRDLLLSVGAPVAIAA